MKAICEGRTTRHDVVQQNLEQYRAVFVRTMQQINVLKSVSKRHTVVMDIVITASHIVSHCRTANGKLHTQAITKYVVGANQG